MIYALAIVAGKRIREGRNSINEPQPIISETT
jgi:hypothetical protein